TRARRSAKRSASKAGAPIEDAAGGAGLGMGGSLGMGDKVRGWVGRVKGRVCRRRRRIEQAIERRRRSARIRMGRTRRHRSALVEPAD
ncbi:MAG: hypothetical protein EA351_08795, partial [Gemmatimonadales bacterium]